MRRERGTGSIYPRGGVWWIKYHKDGRPIRESTGNRVKNTSKSPTTNETAIRFER